MSIQEFLLARVDEDEAETEALNADNAACELGPNRRHRYAKLEHRQSAIYRHHDRSVTVMFIGKFETVTRCAVCIRETSRPCAALKTMAEPYRRHPDFETAWI